MMTLEVKKQRKLYKNELNKQNVKIQHILRYKKKQITFPEGTQHGNLHEVYIWRAWHNAWHIESTQ